MKLTRVLALVALAALGLAFAVGAPEVIGPNLAGVSSLTGALLGLNLMLVGLLVLEILDRREATTALRGRLMSMADMTARLREEVRQLRDAQRAQMAIAPDDGAELESVVAEMRILKSLVEQLQMKRPGDTATPASAPPAPRRADIAATAIPPLVADRGLAADAPRPAAAAKAASGRPVPQAPVASPATPRDAAANALADLTALTDATGQVPFADDGSDVLDYVREALQDDRIELFLRPIVSLPSRRLAYQECVVGFRAPDGTLLSHDDFMPLAEEAGLAGTVYNLLLVRSVQFVRRMRRLKSQLGYFCPIDPQTLRDPDFLADFVDFMRENTDLAGHLIFELTQYDVYRLDMRTERELAALAKSGFRFCLSETTNLDLFVSDLSDRGFRYVKCDPRTLMGKMVGQADPRAVKKELDRGAMDLIVTGIEDEDTLLSLLDYAIDFGEGPLFGDPHPANRKEA